MCASSSGTARRRLNERSSVLEGEWQRQVGNRL
jgi:hypothetical protein